MKHVLMSGAAALMLALSGPASAQMTDQHHMNGGSTTTSTMQHGAARADTDRDRDDRPTRAATHHRRHHARKAHGCRVTWRHGHKVKTCAKRHHA